LTYTINNTPSASNTLTQLMAIPGKPSFTYNQTGTITITSFGVPSAPNWAYSIDGGKTWVTVYYARSFTLVTPGIYTASNFKLKVFTNDGVDSAYSTLPDREKISIYPENPFISYETGTYKYTIVTLAPYTLTWSYSTNGGDIWSNDYTLAQKSSLSLVPGTYLADDILFRNKTSNGITSQSPLIGNPGIQIVLRPGYPMLKFEINTGIINVMTLATGATIWKYSVDSGMNWSDDIVGAGKAHIPAGTYPPGNICIMNYTSDYTSSKWAIANTTTIYSPASTIDYPDPYKISGSYLLDYPTKWIPDPSDTPTNMVKFPNNGTRSIIVTLIAPYVAWEYSLGIDTVTNSRIWITSPTNKDTIQIIPSYYPVFSLGVKLIRDNDTYTTVFNMQESQIYPEAPSVVYIEKGIIVVNRAQYTTSWQYNIDNNNNWKQGINSTLRLPVGNYPVGRVKIRNVIDDILASSHVLNTEEIIVTDTDYDDGGIKANWVTDTVLTLHARRGTNILEVGSTYGFAINHVIIIGYGEYSEIRTVTGIGSLHINIALKNDYPPGTLIRGFDYVDNKIISKELAAFFYENARSTYNRKRGRVSCLNYIFHPEKTTIASCPIGNETKWVFGDKSFASADTKVNRIVSKVQHLKQGKIVYGEHGLSSPFLHPETIEATTVSAYYRCNRPNDVPIVNGLRGGIVPIKMRTNKF